MKIKIMWIPAFAVLLTLSCIFYQISQGTTEDSTLVLLSITPKKVHITESNESIIFIWSVYSSVDYCVLSFPTQNFTIFKYSQFLNEQYIFKHQVNYSKIANENSYWVSCSKNDKSSKRSFKLTLQQTNKIIILGDFSTSKIGDLSNYQHTQRYKPNILNFLKKDYKEVSSIWHLGDIAYDLFSNSGTRGHEFLTDIEPFASEIPYMAIPGNHEIRNNFEDLMSLFANPLYFSSTLGHALIISICSEFDFYQMKPFAFPYKHAYFLYLKQKQLQWLVKTLTDVDRTELLGSSLWDTSLYIVQKMRSPP